MNTLLARFWLPLTLTGIGLGTSGMAAPPAVKGAAPMAGDITIIDTGDAYVPGYRITVGSAGELRAVSFARNGGPTIRRQDQMTPENHKRLLADLAKAAPVNAIPTGITATPFGRRRRRIQTPPPRQIYGAQIFVVYQKRTSPNLRMAASGAGKTVYQDIKQVMQVLGMPVPDVP
ncbi:MAG: hypothetical protein M3Y13_14965 [Armatimonadota bacterium]|nr:hypothetical protein [Armatimonadota bacterium]